MTAAATPVVTAVGGGHGLAATLTALRMLGLGPTAVVSVADDGGSSGRLRRDMDVMPPGDLRRALSTLAGDPLRRDLLEHRFEVGELAGHALGNLVLLAAARLHGDDLAAGLEALGEVFHVRGRVLPTCAAPVDLVADLSDGRRLRGQHHITRTAGIERVRLDPSDVPANPAAMAAIRDSDLVVIGPGSLFTSLLPPLLVPGIRDALLATPGRLVLVANLREQPGETSGMNLHDHLEALFDHVPDELRLDLLVVNDGPVEATATTLTPIPAHPRVDKVVAAPLADRDGGHDPALLADLFADLV